MVSKDFFLALDELERTKGISKDVFISTLETALTSAYKKHFNEASSATVKLDSNKKTIKILKYKTVVENEKEDIDKEKEICLKDAKLVKKSIKVGDKIEQEVTPKDFGRIAAQTAKQVVMQKIREIEKETTLKNLSGKSGQFISTVITRIDGDNVFVRLDESIYEGMMNKYDQIPGEKYYPNAKIKVYIKDVKDNSKFGPMVQVTRSDINFVKKLFEYEIPEIASKEIEIVSVAREAGNRTKVAIKCNTDLTDPLGACVGNRGTRINTIVNEMNGEKVDLVIYSEDPVTYIENALSPATVDKIIEKENGYDVYVPNSKLSLAIGKQGVNVKLAARLTGMKINVLASDNFDEMLSTQSSLIPDNQYDDEEDFEDLFKDEALDEE